MPKYIITKTVQTQVEAVDKKDALEHVRDTNLNHWVEMGTSAKEV